VNDKLIVWLVWFSISCFFLALSDLFWVYLWGWLRDVHPPLTSVTIITLLAIALSFVFSLFLFGVHSALVRDC